MKVECSSCQTPILRRDRIYCPTRERWIPERKYSRRRKCSLHMAGQFRELPWTRPVIVPSVPGTTKDQVLAGIKPVKRPSLLRRILARIMSLFRRS